MVSRSRRARDDILSEATRRIGTNLGVRNTVRLNLSGTIPTPFIFGILRPVLVLPHSLLDMDRDLLEMVLTHELAHVKRRDIARLILLDLFCTIYWPNPLVAQRRTVH